MRDVAIALSHSEESNAVLFLWSGEWRDSQKQEKYPKKVEDKDMQVCICILVLVYWLGITLVENSEISGSTLYPWTRSRRAISD